MFNIEEESVVKKSSLSKRDIKKEELDETYYFYMACAY